MKKSFACQGPIDAVLLVLAHRAKFFKKRTKYGEFNFLLRKGSTCTVFVWVTNSQWEF